jgi:hypothetical protein
MSDSSTLSVRNFRTSNGCGIGNRLPSEIDVIFVPRFGIVASPRLPKSFIFFVYGFTRNKLLCLIIRIEGEDTIEEQNDMLMAKI